ncbi:MAG: DUF423 domain-containing protein [Flavobacteriales bacterium]|nr:DUF423 domain-containing protein [Flavobacteriales bacterium]
MHRPTLATASLVLFTAVALGAFGAHGLRGLVPPEALANWRTGVDYQFVHGLGLLVLAVLVPHLRVATVVRVRVLFTAGVLLFSGSLYLIALREVLVGQHIVRILGPVTPLGGLCFMAGWGLLLWDALRRP